MILKNYQHQEGKKIVFNMSELNGAKFKITYSCDYSL